MKAKKSSVVALDFANELGARIDKLQEERDFYLNGISQRLNTLEKQGATQGRAIEAILEHAEENNRLLLKLSKAMDTLLNIQKSNAIATIATTEALDETR